MSCGVLKGKRSRRWCILLGCGKRSLLHGTSGLNRAIVWGTQALWTLWRNAVRMKEAEERKRASSEEERNCRARWNRPSNRPEPHSLPHLVFYLDSLQMLLSKLIILHCFRRCDIVLWGCLVKTPFRTANTWCLHTHFGNSVQVANLLSCESGRLELYSLRSTF